MSEQRPLNRVDGIMLPHCIGYQTPFFVMASTEATDVPKIEERYYYFIIQIDIYVWVAVLRLFDSTGPAHFSRIRHICPEKIAEKNPPGFPGGFYRYHYFKLS